MLDVKDYCFDQLIATCNSHFNGSEDKELIALIDVANVKQVAEFVKDMVSTLSQYDMQVYTGLDYRKSNVTCLVLHTTPTI